MGAVPDLYYMSLCGAGAVLLRSAGCTVNDLWDRNIDKLVDRTKNRPLASGAISPPQAVAFLGANLAAGLGVLLQFNTFTQALGASSLLLVWAYPAMKRITYWPQAFLGLTINWGALMGWAAVHGDLHLPAVLPLYAGGLFWTLAYDTIYAHQDKKDDVTAGVKSSALRLGDSTKAACTAFAAASTAGMVAAGLGSDAGAAYYVGAGAFGLHMLWQVHSVDLDNGADCMSKFVSNKWAGGLPFAGIMVDKLLGVM
mmetsp:Transcript_70902/g.224469  ORF Transcript_70902/g.224469 Transcript_70902/m.224469 type:complete len:255 (-) Transcript_70902:48-812(-)